MWLPTAAIHAWFTLPCTADERLPVWRMRLFANGLTCLRGTSGILSMHSSIIRIQPCVLLRESGVIGISGLRCLRARLLSGITLIVIARAASN